MLKDPIDHPPAPFLASKGLSDSREGGLAPLHTLCFISLLGRAVLCHPLSDEFDDLGGAGARAEHTIEA